MDYESLAVDAVDRVVSKSDYLESFIVKKEKGPCLDGVILVYNKGGDNHSKENIQGRIPVQIKGKKKSAKFIKNPSYSIETSDLRNFLQRGGAVLFVVLIDENGDDSIYYRSLLPYDIKRLLQIAKNRKSKTVQLQSFPRDIKEATDILMNFSLNMNAQKADSSITEILTIEELKKRGGITALTFSCITTNTAHKDPINYVIQHGTYLYAKTTLGVLIPVDFLDNPVISEEINTPVKVGEKVFYDSYVVHKKKERFEIHFGNSFTFSANHNDKKASTRFLLRGTLSERIRDAQFLLSLQDNHPIVVGNHALPPIALDDFKGLNLERFSEVLSELLLAKQMLDFFDVTEELRCDTLTEHDWFNLRRLISAYQGNEITLIDTGIPYGSYTIGNLHLIICATKNSETNRFTISNMYSAPFRIVYKDEKEKKWFFPVFIALKAHEIAACSNINQEKIVDQINPIDYTFSENVEFVVSFMLEVIKAYDINNKEAYLSLAERILDVLQEKGHTMQPDMLLLNRLQIFKRQRPLSEEERKQLLGIIKEDQKDEETKLGAFLLLGADCDARATFKKLPAERKKIFSEYPIYHFFPKD